MKLNEMVARGIRIRLADLEKSRNWLAEESGIPYATLSKKLQKKQTWTTDEIDRVAKPLQVSPFDLIAGRVVVKADYPVSA